MKTKLATVLLAALGLAVSVAASAATSTYVFKRIAPGVSCAGDGCDLQAQMAPSAPPASFDVGVLVAEAHTMAVAAGEYGLDHEAPPSSGMDLLPSAGRGYIDEGEFIAAAALSAPAYVAYPPDTPGSVAIAHSLNWQFQQSAWPPLTTIPAGTWAGNYDYSAPGGVNYSILADDMPSPGVVPIYVANTGQVVDVPGAPIYVGYRDVSFWATVSLAGLTSNACAAVAAAGASQGVTCSGGTMTATVTADYGYRYDLSPGSQTDLPSWWNFGSLVWPY